jgi:hypothetical protein
MEPATIRLQALLMLTVLGILGGCVLMPLPGGLPISGVVQEEGTGRPLPGVSVVAHWRAVGLFRSGSNCFHVETTVSDARGNFSTPVWVKWHAGADWETMWYLYLPGYYRANRMNELRPDGRQPIERLGYLDDLSRRHIRCPGDPRGNVLSVLERINNEAQSIELETPTAVNLKRGINAMLYSERELVSRRERLCREDPKQCYQ